ncbi:MAG: succinate dehydrogenase hydrophobic membrane anchor subunit [Mycobacteriaceae bacterium]
MSATTDRPSTVAAPRAPHAGYKQHTPKKSNYEMYSWIFMRLSGLALIVLVIGHLLIMNILDGGVHRINFGFVAGRWASPFWQFWDLSMLWLAQLHGGNGLRTVINDYARKDTTRFWLQALLAVSMVLIVGLGTYVIFTFDPNIR